MKPPKHNRCYSHIDDHTYSNLLDMCAETGRTSSDVIRQSVSIYLCNWLMAKQGRDK